MKRQIAIFALVGVALVALTIKGFRDSRSALLARDVCEAAQSGDHERAVGLSTGDDVVDADRDAWLGCVCVSFVALQRGEACADLVERLDAPVPQLPQVADGLYAAFSARRDAPRARDAARAAVASLEVPPRSWLDRAVAADPVLDEAYWTQAARASVPVAVAVAYAALGLGHNAYAVDVLGAEPANPEFHPLWRQAAMAALVAARGEQSGVDELERRVAAGEPRVTAEFDYLVAMFQAMRMSPRVEQALHFAWNHRAELEPDARPLLANRLIQQLNAAGRHDELAAVVDACVAEGIVTSLNQAQVRSMLSANRDRRGQLSFVADINGVVFVSPDDKAPVDTPFERYPVVAGQTRVIERSVGDHPVRFVLRDTEGRTRGGRQVWLVPDREQRVALTAREPWQVPAAAPAERKPADGKRSIVLVVADSGDWRYLQYGFATQQLPVLEALVARSATAVMISDPPSTSAAMLRLTEPSPVPKDQALLLRRLGSQADAALGLGGNPLEAARLLSQSARPSLFDVLAKTKRVLNMLGHGQIKAGAAGLTGPQGHVDLNIDQHRALRPDEGIDQTLFADAPVFQAQLETAAAQLDFLVTQLSARAADLYLYRYDPTDMLAHNFLASWSGNIELTAESRFFDAYRYFDLRLRDVIGATDGDDIVMVISDHGTQNSANHDPRSLFVLHGADIAPSRLEGVRIENIPSYLAGQLCVVDPWKSPAIAPLPRCPG